MGAGSQNLVDIVERGVRLELPENPQDGSCTPTEGSRPNSPARMPPDGASDGEDSPRAFSQPFQAPAPARLPVFPSEDDFGSRMREARATRELSESLKARPKSLESQRQSRVDGHQDVSTGDQHEAPVDGHQDDSTGDQREAPTKTSGIKSTTAGTRPTVDRLQMQERENHQQGDSSDEQPRAQRSPSVDRSTTASRPSPDSTSPSTSLPATVKRSLMNPSTTTTFTAADIPFPTYGSRQKKKKSKKRSKDNGK